MKKYLVTIEFRYYEIPKHEELSGYANKTITIGIYDNFSEACTGGNALMEVLESKFPLHKFPGGYYAHKERFSANGGCFGSKYTLITNLAYLTTPFDFYAKITTLNCDGISTSVDEVTASVKKYRELKAREE